ncbi:HTTM domain-containing protein [Halorubrum ezzemoulense]|uniref:HTTM domain-containing protein n=1 Tax=Halorubrum ezzemoulense TaxID=337243 RepID=UPI00232E4FCB|nr:HTTM domain-containing protein [Halorubrum ezzemoulense]MDB9233262.1 HTTM domain-containing protein [Halorubrum ezzemoulense]
MARSSSVATARSRFRTVVRRLSAALAARCSVDLRALAAFRIGLGALVIADLIRRSRSLSAFYTDDGVLPRSALFADYGEVYSVHALVGEPWAVTLLFALAGAFALALLAGYRTRLAALASWLLLLSLHARNPMVLNSGDSLLRMLLFWSVFLPLGARWSVDALRRAGAGTDADAAAGAGGSERDPGADDGDESATAGPSGSAVATVATMAVLIQVLLMYVTNGIHKRGSDLWMDGEAVAYIMQADHFTYLLGNQLAEFTGLLRGLTVLWIALLFASPLLILLTGIPRAAIASLFVGMHLGMAVTMPIGLFPIVVVVGFVPFFQTPVWDAAERAVDRFGPPAALERWRARLESVGDALASLDASIPRPTPSGALAGLRARVGRGRPLLSTVVPYVFLVLIVLSSAQAVGYAETPDPAENALETVEMDQHWRMFAPDPTRTTRWFVTVGTLADGTERDVLRDSPVEFDRPPRAEATYRSARWRKYLGNVASTDNENHRSYLANYLCEDWNRTRETAVENVTIHQQYERTDPYNGSVVAANGFELIEYDCSGEFIQDE